MNTSGFVYSYVTQYGSIIPYTLMVSDRRKTLALEIDGRGLVVRVPTRTRQSEIVRLLSDNTLWIMRKLAQIESNRPPGKLNAAVEDSVYYFRGQEFRLKPRPATARFPVGEIRLMKKVMEVAVFSELAADDPELHIARPIREWYFKQAQQLVPPLVDQYCRKLRVKKPIVIIRDQKNQWGSCNDRNELRINFRIAIPPDEIAEYIVAHEVCHLIELNHSPRFWQLVGKLLPNYQRLRMLLQDWEARMQL